MVASLIVLALTSLQTELPTEPEKTSLLFDPSGTNLNLPSLSSNPKNPNLAALPLCHLNSIPLSLSSSLPGVESPQRVKIGSSTVTVFEFTVVVVPFTVKLPAIVTLLGNQTVPVPADSATSTSLEVP